MTVYIPMRLAPEANKHEHWAKKAKRVKRQRWVVERVLDTKLAPPLPVVVKLTHIAPRPFDSDNRRRAFKAIRDEIAKWLGTTDAPGSGIIWQYRRRRGKVREYGIEIAVRARTEDDVDEEED